MDDSRGNPLVAIIVLSAMVTGCALAFAFVMTIRGHL